MTNVLLGEIGEPAHGFLLPQPRDRVRLKPGSTGGKGGGRRGVYAKGPFRGLGFRDKQTATFRTSPLPHFPFKKQNIMPRKTTSVPSYHFTFLSFITGL